MGNGTLAPGTKIPCRVSRTLDGAFYFTNCGSNKRYSNSVSKNTHLGTLLAGPIIFTVADGLVHHADTIAYLLEVGYEIYAYVGIDNVKITTVLLVIPDRQRRSG